MRRLTTLLVLAFLAWLLFWPDDEPFRCDAAPTPGAAHADTGCPSYIDEAVNDPEWAREQQDLIRDQPLTVGRFITPKRDEPSTMRSGFDNLSRYANSILKSSDDFPYPAVGRPNVITDVETKLAALMRRNDIPVAVVAINHPEVCVGAMSCTRAIPAILGEGQTLYVWELDAEEPQKFTGGS
jgi:hypothetical protein